MRKLIIALFLVVASIAGSGCAYVTSDSPGFTIATGESWYTKNKFILFIPIGTDIYYCPVGQPGTCYLAKVK
jgi:hypothetical protein